MIKKLLLSLLLFFSIKSSERIIVDLNKTENLNLSNIAQRVVPIHLDKETIFMGGIAKIYLLGNNIYVFQRYKEKGSMTTHTNVFRFDFSGNYKGELVVMEPLTGKPLEIIDMQSDENNNRLFLSYHNGYRVFDCDGNFLSYKEQVALKFIYKGLFWYVENSHRGNIADYSLVTTDLNGLKKDTVKSVKALLPMNLVNAGVIPFALPSFSIHDGELYISYGIDNTIYHVNQETLIPIYKIEFKNRLRSEYDLFGAPSQLVFNKYVKYGIRVNGIQGDVLFDTREKKSYFFKDRKSVV